MQHIKSYMNKIDAIIKSGASKKPVKKNTTNDTGVSDKNLYIVANIVKGIREAREEMLNAK